MQCQHEGCDRVTETAFRLYCREHNSHQYARQRAAEAERRGITADTYRERRRKGWTHEQALQPLLRPRTTRKATNPSEINQLLRAWR